jgi:hypothetical protein
VILGWLRGVACVGKAQSASKRSDSSKITDRHEDGRRRHRGGTKGDRSRGRSTTIESFAGALKSGPKGSAVRAGVEAFEMSSGLAKICRVEGDQTAGDQGSSRARQDGRGRRRARIPTRQ